MKSFLVILQGKNPAALMESLLQDHVTFIKELHAQGHLVLCGPFNDNNRAMFVLQAENLRYAEQLIRKDPFIKYSYYKSFEIYEFTPANCENNWLIQQ